MTLIHCQKWRVTTTLKSSHDKEDLTPLGSNWHSEEINHCSLESVTLPTCNSSRVMATLQGYQILPTMATSLELFIFTACRDTLIEQSHYLIKLDYYFSWTLRVCFEPFLLLNIVIMILYKQRLHLILILMATATCITFYNLELALLKTFIKRRWYVEPTENCTN